MEKKFYLGGKWVVGKNTFDVLNPFNQEIIASVHMADEENVQEAIKNAQEALEKSKKLLTYERVDALNFISKELQGNREELASILSQESGKPYTESLGEIDRGVMTFKIAAEEVATSSGEIMPLDISPASGNRMGMIKRFPIGIVYGISPFNFPLNLVSHKVAPALAVGAPIILKPASATPLTALKLAEIFDKTDLPKGLFQVLPMDRKSGDLLVEDERISLLSFTGSPGVGWDMKNRAGKKRVVLELGGDAAVYVHKDADLDFAAKRAAIGAFANAGQICISVQRIVAHEQIYDKFKEKFLEEVKNLKVGDPSLKETQVGPMIDPKNKDRILSWISEAKDRGTKILLEGEVKDYLVHPTILEETPKGIKVSDEEAFGPIVNMYKVSSSKEAFEKINNSKFGLQAGVFTNNNQVIFDSFEEIHAGGVVINDVPTFRVDNMPYGGIKDSGFGREGIKYAIEDMTEVKVMVLNNNQRYDEE